MTQQQNFNNLQKTIEQLTKTQQKALFEEEKKAILYNNLYVYLYNNYIKGFNIYSAHFKIEAIAHICNNSPHLYSERLTLAYIQKIYTKTCGDVVKEYKQAQQFEQEHQAEPITEKPQNQKSDIVKILIIASYIILISYIFILA